MTTTHPETRPPVRVAAARQSRLVLRVGPHDISTEAPRNTAPDRFVGALQPGGLGRPGYITAPRTEGRAPEAIVLEYSAAGDTCERTWVAASFAGDRAEYVLASDTSSTGYVSTRSPGSAWRA